MPDPIKTATEPIPPVAVTIVGTGDGNAPPPATGTIAVTPGPFQPNLIVTVVTPFVAIMVRFANTFCVAFSGALTAGGLTGQYVMPHSDLVSLVKSAAFIAAVTAGYGLVKDSATVFSGLEKKFPLASGSV